MTGQPGTGEPMDQALRLYGRVVRSCCIIAGWALMAISVATCIEIITRKYFGFTFKGLDEIGGNMLAGVSALGFAYALTTRAHMRVTILFGYIANSLQSILNVLAILTLSAMAVFCAWRGVFEFLDSFASGKRSNTPLQVPVWIPQGVWLAGMALFALGAVLMALHALALLPRDRGRLNRLYGPQTLDEEISSEVELAETREGVKGGAR